MLTVDQRRICWGDLMQEWSRDEKPIPVLKDVLLSSVNAIDDWIDGNSTSFNNALPATVRAALSTEQKVELFILVLRHRYLAGKA